MAWDSTVGALLIGGLAGGVLFGLTCMQSYLYFNRRHQPEDGPIMRVFIAVLWLLDTVDFAFNNHTIYHYLVTNFTNPLVFSNEMVPWSMSAHVLITVVADFLIRTLYARIIFRPYLNWTQFAPSLLDLAFGIFITVKSFFFASFVAGVSADTYVALVLCYYLYRSRTGFQTRTDSIINILTMYIINTAAQRRRNNRSIAMPNNFIFIAFYLQFSKRSSSYS
ncbi:hypothetical protein K488DRAFT_71078 [Vararia minispora EC-137]|uniref:Uncharacterized protein n=1 Tax=Vararia minispora EC-137 TaxID=1314806 RepID=A0ACB8QJQ8_9AGAM|nr:hypothetical protein K488DRAFT_71078 [Vararia minispora EC-137]